MQYLSSMKSKKNIKADCAATVRTGKIQTEIHYLTSARLTVNVSGITVVRVRSIRTFENELDRTATANAES